MCSLIVYEYVPIVPVSDVHHFATDHRGWMGLVFFVPFLTGEFKDPWNMCWRLIISPNLLGDVKHLDIYQSYQNLASNYGCPSVALLMCRPEEPDEEEKPEDESESEEPACGLKVSAVRWTTRMAQDLRL